MDLSCNCLGAASAAKVPVKRYNLLVPDIFPVVEPSFHKTLSPSVERKIKKLSEYLERNEHRAPKVSRRLARRLFKDLRHRRYGYVKLAVQAYSYLLRASKPELSNLFAAEVVVRSAEKRKRDWLCLHRRGRAPAQAAAGSMGSVVGVLLVHPSVDVKMLGVELLTEFIRLQNTSDYVDQLESFVPLLCTSANPKARYQAGASAAPKAPSPEDLSAFQAACLRALLEHLRYCGRLAYVSHHLDTITYCVLDAIDSAGAAPGQNLLDIANQAREAMLSGESPAGLQRTSIGMTVGMSPPQVAALLVFEEISHITRDAAEGKKVLEFLMRYLDSSGDNWLGGPVLDAGLGIMRQACMEEHQRYLLYSTLLRHVVTPGLSQQQRVAVLQQAVQDGVQLEQALAAPALLLALRELPPVVHSTGGGEQGAPTYTTATSAAAAAAAPAGSQEPSLVKVAGAAAPGANGALGPEPGQIELVAQRPVPATVQAGAAGATGATSAAGVNGDGGLLAASSDGASSFRAAVLAAVLQLAGCVGEAGPLLEVIASTVSRLSGPQGASSASTAALECCIAAAEAIQGLPEEARVLAGHTFPQLLLQELMVVMATWDLQQRLLAHRLLLLLLPAAGDGLKDWQARALLSTVYHEVAFADNSPAAFVALDACFASLISSSPAAALGQAVQLAATLQAEVAAGGERLRVPAAACCAVLCLCKSMLQQLAAMLSYPELGSCAVAGCDTVLTSLVLIASGLQLGQSNISTAKHGGVVSGAGSRDVPGSPQAALAAPVLPAAKAAADAAAAGAFKPAEEQQAQLFLQSLRASTSSEQELGKFRRAWAGAPLLRQYGSQGVGAGFSPLPVTSLAPRMKAAGVGAGGPGGSHGGSSASLESQWVQRVRELYRSVPTMRDISATIDLQELLPESAGGHSSIATTGSPATLSQQYLDALHVAPLEGKSADDVLSEIDTALSAMEGQVANGRSPKHVRMLSL